jgi:3-hydroxyisobutyrate dehydrogenase
MRRPAMSAKPAIAFIGTGVMGRSMAGHLLAAGHELHVFNRTRDKAQPLLDSGARWHDSAGEAAAQADVVVTMLGFPRDVEETYLGAGGVVERARPGSLLIDMTTSSPLLARRSRRPRRPGAWRPWTRRCRAATSAPGRRGW